MNARRSIKSALRYFQVRMAFLLAAVIVIFLGISLWNTMSYSRFFYAYQNLQNVFDQSDSAVNSIRSYLATGNTEDLNRYHASLTKAEESVQDLQANPVIDEKWRLGLLANSLSALDQSGRTLIVTYQDPAQASSYQEVYEEFLHRQDLISQTATDYYHMLTKSMSSRMQALTVLNNCILLLSVAAALVMITLLSRLNGFFTRNISSPMEMIFENIQRIQNGKYDLIVPETNSQEIADLYSSLEDLAARVKSSLEMEKRNADLEKKLAQSEVRMLQNQINPHFLFNTLNTIYCMAEADGADKAADMLIKTSHLLRYGLDMQNRISTLCDELKAMQDYVDIQKIRLQDKIEFRCEVSLENGIASLPVPGMILQPLLENSVKHGLKDALSGGIVEVRVRSEGRDVSISLCDNGKGMDEKTLEAMIQSDFQNTDSHGYGLYNVVHRLKAFYGRNVSLDFSSAPGQGFLTQITIRNAGDEYDPAAGRRR